jgi:hypothetical protein
MFYVHQLKSAPFRQREFAGERFASPGRKSWFVRLPILLSAQGVSVLSLELLTLHAEVFPDNLCTLRLIRLDMEGMLQAEDLLKLGWITKPVRADQDGIMAVARNFNKVRLRPGKTKSGGCISILSRVVGGAAVLVALLECLKSSVAVALPLFDDMKITIETIQIHRRSSCLPIV